MEECEQLKQMNVRSVEMIGDDGAMQPTPEGEIQLLNIWETSCAPIMGPTPWPDFAAFRQEVITLTNTASTDPGVAAVFQQAVTVNNASITATYRPILQATGFCIQTKWFNIYIWRRV